MDYPIKRKLDSLGRLVLPAEFRMQYALSPGDAIACYPAPGAIRLCKATHERDTATMDQLGRIALPETLRVSLKLSTASVIAIFPRSDGMYVVPEEALAQTDLGQ